MLSKKTFDAYRKKAKKTNNAATQTVYTPQNETSKKADESTKKAYAPESKLEKIGAQNGVTQKTTFAPKITRDDLERGAIDN